MKCVVTGAAGFIGSHLCERLLQLGHLVVGIDSFNPYYGRPFKVQNLRDASAHKNYLFCEADLRTDPLEAELCDADYVFHLAAMPGLTQSWIQFDEYWTCNVVATQRLLETLRQKNRSLKKLIFASTSSVYGKFASGDESLPTRPISPYGVTKLAAEQLGRSYCDGFGLPVVTMRFFSVYGPRQRPDMAYHRFIQAMEKNQPITLYGDGMQVRGNTYVGDCVEAVLLGMDAHAGEIYNIGGGEMVSVWDVLKKLETITGKTLNIHREEARIGDQRHTFADTTKLKRHLGWEPRVGLDEGLKRQWLWQREVE
jgi:nucleoside-diphosphate-sugar epimerase